MSVSQYQNEVNRLDREITDIEKKIGQYDKTIADEESKIGSIERGITKNTSASMLRLKAQQIDSHKKSRERALTNKAQEQRKLADKRDKRRLAYQRLQRAEQNESVKERKAQQQHEQSMIRRYESRIADLSAQMESMLNMQRSNAVSTLAKSERTEEYDVFISHAWEDKESFVDEFVRILVDNYNLKVWYDKTAIKWGDSQRAKINDGLHHSKFAVVVLSPDYLKKYWTQYELNGLFQREVEAGKVILPIWHHVSRKEVADYDLALADRNALNTAMMTPEEIAEYLVQILQEAEDANLQEVTVNSDKDTIGEDDEEAIIRALLE